MRGTVPSTGAGRRAQTATRALRQASLAGFAYPAAHGIEHLAYQRCELADVFLIRRVEVTAGALVGQLQQPVRVPACAADAGREPASHRWMTGRDAAEVTKERVAHHLVLGQAHDLARRDRHAVQTNALRIEAELPESRVLLAEAEVLA